MIESSIQLLYALYKKGYDNPSEDPWWWPNSGTFETVAGAILTQNTQWKSVEASIRNLHEAQLLNPDALSRTETDTLERLIRPSGFYRSKAEYLQRMSQNMISDFGSFKAFQRSVNRKWLLEQKGVGQETADAILNYACHREALVVDSYTQRLLQSLGYTLKLYSEVQMWMLEGIGPACREIFSDMPLAQCYARYHGMVVEYCKKNGRGREIDTSGLLGL